jgi:hypothetical protein
MDSRHGGSCGLLQNFSHFVNTHRGLLTIKAMRTFTGTVNGLPGTLDLLFIGKVNISVRPITLTLYWVILSGTGELVNLCGEGTYWRTGVDDLGRPIGTYTAQIHFDP